MDMGCQLQVTSHHMTSPPPTKCGEKVWRMMQLSSKIELAKKQKWKSCIVISGNRNLHQQLYSCFNTAA